MHLTRLIGPTIFMAFGFFILSQGIDSLKVEHFGIRLVTVEWFARVTTLSYHQTGVSCIVLGFLLMGAGRARMYFRAIPEHLVVSAILVAVLLGFVGWGIVN
jgi:hypothetical protein